MAKSESKQPGSLTFDSPDGPVVVVRVVDNHAWRNFDAATMEPLALNPLPFVSAALEKDGHHAEVCFSPQTHHISLTIMFLGEDKVEENREYLKDYASNLLLTAADLRARAGIEEDWQSATAAWHAREAEQRNRLRSAVPPGKLATYDAWWTACREMCALRKDGNANGKVVGGPGARARIEKARTLHLKADG